MVWSVSHLVGWLVVWLVDRLVGGREEMVGWLEGESLGGVR